MSISDTIRSMKRVITIIIGLILVFVGYVFITKNETTPQDNTQENDVQEQYLTMQDIANSKYLSLTDWPPQVQNLEQAYSCEPAGESTERAGGTETKTISGVEYCVTTVTEGAAGSTYHQYAYATQDAEGTVIYTFTARLPQCTNYPEEEVAICQDEQSRFNPDALLNTFLAG